MRYAMKLRRLLILLILGCAATKKPSFRPDIYVNGIVTRIDTFTWVDSSRARVIPIAIYNRENLTNELSQR